MARLPQEQAEADIAAVQGGATGTAADQTTDVENEIAHLRGLDLEGLRARWRTSLGRHGLEQDFNSLDAQREAAEASRVRPMRAGRPVRDAYDDGGFSGGSIDRQAVQRLLA